MAIDRRSGILRDIHTLFNLGTIGGQPDGRLLELFTSRGEAAEPAFAALVERHGPMVLRVCRAVLRDAHSAQDAFQVTFLVLAHKAGSLRVQDSLGPWLHGVAYRTAACARSAEARRLVHERRAAEMASHVVEGPDQDDSRQVLHQEVDRLPERYRKPVVLCYLEGLTHEQAARQLGWPVGTVRSRLAWGRERLRWQLTRRGLAPVVGALVATLSRDAGAAVPASLAESTVRATMKIAAGQATAGVVSASVAALLEGVLTTMSLIRTKLAIAAILVLGTGVGVLAYQASGDAKDKPAPRQAAAHTAAQGDPAPVVQDTNLLGNFEPKDKALQDKIDRLSAELLRVSSRNAIIDREMSRLKDDLTKVTARLKSSGPAPRDDQASQGPRAKAFNEALEKPIEMSFANETPLEDVLKYIMEATRGPDLPRGIPIYVDPVGLNEAEKTMTSPITMNLEGVPLKTTLRLLLAQLGLIYEVKPGELMLITSHSNEGFFMVPNNEEQTVLNAQQQKAERGELNPDEMKFLIEQLKAIGELRRIQAEIGELPQRVFGKQN